MQEDLLQFLEAAELLSTDQVIWGKGTLPLQVSYYKSASRTPHKYVSSVRGIIFEHERVMVVREPGGHLYILPGGRVEKGESLIQTLRRELLEETGWTIESPRRIGFMHLHHLGPRPEDYIYPFPDFVWPVFTAGARDFVPSARVPDRWVDEYEFQPVEEVRSLPLEKGQLRLLDAAIAVRSGR